MAIHSILIVEDNSDMLLIYAAILRYEGFEVFTAETGEACLSQINTVVPDIFLIDVVLPDWNGIELLKEIKSRPEFSNALIVLLSGLEIDTESKVDDLSAGAVDYLVRPIPNKEIVAKIKSLIKILELENSLVELSRGLEKAVADRTKELSATVDALHAEVQQRITAEQEVRELNVNLEEAVEARTALLHDALQELEAFSYSISHDLKAPLQHIKSYCEMITQEHAASLQPDLAKMFQRISHASQTMSDYIDGLLNLSRYSRAEIHSTTVDLGRIARELVDELVKEQAVACEFSITSISALCDPVLIRFVLQNLLGNAVKFSRNSPSPAIRFEGDVTETEVICWFRDNGVGFTCPGDHLFNLFRRNVSEKEFEGSGIGLSIVKKIISRHDGRVFAESSAENGTKIGFALPRYPAEQLTSNLTTRHPPSFIPPLAG